MLIQRVGQLYIWLLIMDTLRLLSKLINAGSDVNLEQKNGVAPLHLATQKGTQRVG